MIKNRILRSLFVLFLFLPIAFLGCSGGGDDAPAPVPSPSIKVLPSSYYFGVVTPGNVPSPLEVEIQNNGSLTLNVSSITLSDDINLILDEKDGSNPCGILSPSIAPGGNCTVVVEFDPQPGSPDAFSANLTITSDASNNSSLNVPLTADQDDVSALNVRINQVESTEICPNPEVTAYVSVTDQGGYPVTLLEKDDFLITEDGVNVGHPTNASSVKNIATISVALVMDYSGSIIDEPDAVGDMEESAAYFVDQLRGPPGVVDEAEIIKFADDPDVVQSWQLGTEDGKNLLEAAITAPYENGRETTLYDAVVKAVDDMALQSTARRAVIVITDGKDTQSLQTLDDVINDANNEGVPIFTIGLGILDPTILQQMADETGGQFFEARTSDNLRTIYEQLAAILFNDQYILTYTSGLGDNVTAGLTIEATYSPTIKGKNDPPKKITPCP